MYVFDLVYLCFSVIFPALFLAETIINTLALFVGLMASFRHLV